jgi:uncharacterized membrane protein YgcG
MIATSLVVIYGITVAISLFGISRWVAGVQAVRTVTLQRVLPLLGFLVALAFCGTAVFVAGGAQDATAGGVATAAASLDALMDVPLYLCAWTAAIGLHPLLSAAKLLRESRWWHRCMFAVMFAAAILRVVFAAVLTADPVLNVTWGSALQLDPGTAPSTADVVALCVSGAAFLAAVVLTSVAPWRALLPRFRRIKLFCFAASCCVFVTPAAVVVSEAVSGENYSLWNPDSAATWPTVAFAILLPRLVCATAVLLSNEHLVAIAARANAQLRASFALPAARGVTNSDGSIASTASTRGAEGAEGRSGGGGSSRRWLPAFHGALGPGVAREATVSMVNPISEVELMGAELTPELTGRSRIDSVGFGVPTHSYISTTNAGAFGDAEEGSASVPSTPHFSLPPTPVESGNSDARAAGAGGAVEWGGRRGQW